MSGVKSVELAKVSCIIATSHSTSVEPSNAMDAVSIDIQNVVATEKLRSGEAQVAVFAWNGCCRIGRGPGMLG